jgi:pimeloyl-ACP methyl ester carboxylesterase
MIKPLIVFVHGGQHTKQCWQPTIDVINAKEPALQTLAVNLPGHGDEPGDLASLNIAQCVDAVVAKIQQQGAEQVMLVGHSMAGITIPGVAAKLGGARVHRMVYLACCIPPQGQRVIDTLHMPMNLVAGFAAKFTKVSKPLPNWFASWVFANGATQAQKQFTHSCLCNESPKVTVEPVDRGDYPDLPATWILPLRDRAVNPALQRKFIQNIGGVDEVLEIDTCHNAMVSEPETVADIIMARC